MATTITPNKTVDVSAYLAWTSIATANQSIGAAIDVATKRRIRFFVNLARQSGTAFTAGWPNVRIEFSPKSTGEVGGDWIPVASYQMALGASIVNTTLSAGISAGATTFTVTSATNIAAGDYLFIGDATIGNAEIVRVKSVSGTTITPEENIVNAHSNGAAVYDQSEPWCPELGVETVKRVRAVVDNAGSGQTIAAKINYTTYDSDAA